MPRLPIRCRSARCAAATSASSSSRAREPATSEITSRADLRDRTIAITGAASGIGADTAELALTRGARVALLDRDEARLTAIHWTLVDRFGSNRAIAIGTDVTDRASVETAFQQVERAFGRVDAAVACAGILRDNLLFRMSEEDWDDVMDVHLRGAFLVARAAQGLMVPRRAGRIILLSSISALGLRGQANYAAAKAGIQGLARTLAIELGPFGITTNAVAPGYVDTAMTRAVAARQNLDWDALAEAWAKEVPLGRIARPRDISVVIAFLLSDDAAYVNGQTIYVAGGPRG